MIFKLALANILSVVGVALFFFWLRSIFRKRNSKREKLTFVDDLDSFLFGEMFHRGRDQTIKTRDEGE